MALPIERGDPTAVQLYRGFPTPCAGGGTLSCTNHVHALRSACAERVQATSSRTRAAILGDRADYPDVFWDDSCRFAVLHSPIRCVSPARCPPYRRARSHQDALSARAPPLDLDRVWNPGFMARSNEGSALLMDTNRSANVLYSFRIASHAVHPFTPLLQGNRLRCVWAVMPAPVFRWTWCRVPSLSIEPDGRLPISHALTA